MKGISVVATYEKLGLTRREADVLLWISRGQTNAEIGSSLHISPRTVKKHLEHVYRKLGVNTRLAAAVRASQAYAKVFRVRRIRAVSSLSESPQSERG